LHVHSQSYAVDTIWVSVTVQQFIQWNPSLTLPASDPNTCELSPGLRYCAGVSGVASTPPATTAATSTSATKAASPTSTEAMSATTPTALEPPGPVQSGIAATCNSYTLVATGTHLFDELYAITDSEA